ncbi:hypothetical protein [Methylobacter sp. sgz302048]|uniref:hypothetical protein n=1 Tax=Methylobacter sp. sgz302048 TaxID=3455945 RepID=UPI003FA04A58
MKSPQTNYNLYQHQNFNQYLTNKVFVLMGSISGLIAVLSFLSDSFMITLDKLFGFSVNFAPFLFLSISIILFSFIYLQSGGSEKINSSNNVLDKILKDKYYEYNKRFSNLENQITNLREVLENEYSNSNLSNDEKEKIIKEVIINTGEATLRSIFDEEASKLHERITQSLSFERFSSSSKGIIERLQREISDLRLRSNINLLIGMTITACGLYLLWSTVSMVDASQLLKQLASEGDESNGKFLKNLILPILPRILLIIFVEVFAYFFLSLYKNGLSEIKYFQNELTNVESKLVSVEFSYITGCQESLKSSLNALSHTERNFVLEKGQTTVELEKARSESELTRNIIKTIPNLFRQKNK